MILAEAIHGCDFNTLALTGGITLAIPASLLDCGIRLFLTPL